MYTVYDFINNDIESKHMKAGWRVEMQRSFIVLRYTILNFDWKSLDYLGSEVFDLFLNSKSCAIMKAKLDKALKKHKQLYFEALSISELKFLLEDANIQVDVDKLVSKTISKKSEKIQQDNKRKERYKANEQTLS